MKAFLMAAGKGTRLKPYTDTHPKCLIPIHGTPLLRIWIDLLARHGVSEVLINTHHHADQVTAFIDAYRPHTALALRTVHEPRLLGSAGTLWHNRAFVRGETDFLIAYADNLTNQDLAKLFDMHRGFRSMGGVLTMGLIRAPEPTQCGIVTLDGQGRIIRFVEKPEAPESDLANGGIYVASNAIFDYYGASESMPSEVLDIGHHLLPRLVGRMFGWPLDGYLKDIGNPDAYHQALAEWPAACDI
ncbi:nucleotidyltransferase family protein [Desulfatitalea alkaliphila]|uniref:Nucleotidyltransferase family protein n=1 Tax=Desulfatitalea alkaliphila TaxID=2929485 RepID=A0AA41R5M6_9BACT|nr:nucleotidyltransferase family protein [Desulfatitalea alkaliphila]MCJ8502779.1 nucleotidyltransferase family protein [Desulfatitalea alkaliphila]